MKVPVVAQYRVAREGRFKGRYYYLDFALPDRKIAIECDGKYWHTGKFARRHRLRQQELEGLGWSFVRFTGSQIVTDLRGCASVLSTLLGG